MRTSLSYCLFDGCNAICMLCDMVCELLYPKVTNKWEWWLLMAWCLFRLGHLPPSWWSRLGGRSQAAVSKLPSNLMPETQLQRVWQCLYIGVSSSLHFLYTKSSRYYGNVCFKWPSLCVMVISILRVCSEMSLQNGTTAKQGKSEGFEGCDRPIVRKCPIWVKFSDVLSRVTLKFDGWPWKTIGHLSFAVSSFVQHFIAIGEFKLELLSRNAQFGSN